METTGTRAAVCSFLALTCGALTSSARADSSPPPSAADTAHAMAAHVQMRDLGPRVYIGERPVYRGVRTEEIISPLAWSRSQDAIAFATRRRGFVQLIVVVVTGEARGHVMRWPVPAPRAGSERATVTWLGPRRVAFGPDQLRPALVASWRLAR